MFMNTTKEGVIVEKGQVWRDLDKRMDNRHAKVEAVRDGKAIMYACTANGRIINAMREIKVAIRRMHKSSTGWVVVSSENGKVTTVTIPQRYLGNREMAQPLLEAGVNADGYELFDWLDAHGAMLKPSSGTWNVVLRNDKTTILGTAEKPSAAILDAVRRNQPATA